MSFPGLILEHFYVQFGDTSYIDFRVPTG